MKLRIPLAASLAVLILTTISSTSAHAECNAYDLRIGIAAPYFKGSNINQTGRDWGFKTPPLESAGIGVDLEIAFIWNNFAIAIEQQFTGTFSVRTSVSGDPNHNYIGYFDKGDGAFIGATYFELKEYIRFGSSTVTISEGIGAIYGGRTDKKYVFPGDNDAAFAFKAAVQYTYDFTDQYGIGIGIEYAGAIKSTDYWHYAHHVVPSVSFLYHM